MTDGEKETKKEVGKEVCPGMPFQHSKAPTKLYYLGPVQEKGEVVGLQFSRFIGDFKVFTPPLVVRLPPNQQSLKNVRLGHTEMSFDIDLKQPDSDGNVIVVSESA